MSETKQSAIANSIQFSLLQLLVAVVVVAALLGVFLKYGSLSTLVLTLGATAGIALFRNFTKNWATRTRSDKIGAAVKLVICGLLLLAILGGLWSHLPVRENRLQTQYNFDSSFDDVDIYLFRGKGGLFVRVSGNVESETDFQRLRKSILDRFESEKRGHVRWKIRVENSNTTIEGSDSELFGIDTSS